MANNLILIYNCNLYKIEVSYWKVNIIISFLEMRHLYCRVSFFLKPYSHLQVQPFTSRIQNPQFFADPATQTPTFLTLKNSLKYSPSSKAKFNIFCYFIYLALGVKYFTLKFQLGVILHIFKFKYFQ
jgi:hypothetical protein